jgi:hypothetical protein
MTQESELHLFSQFELFMVYTARMVSCIFIFSPIASGSLTKYFILMSAITCVFSIFGSYLTMAVKAKHRFAINLAELSYVVGMGRSAMVFLSLVTIGNFLLNIGLYLNLIRSAFFGLNC